MRKFSASRALFGTISPQYLNISLYEFVSNIFTSNDKELLHNMDENGEFAAEEEVVFKQNDEVVVKATEEEHWQARES